jgi:hypothetical protein
MRTGSSVKWNLDQRLDTGTNMVWLVCSILHYQICRSFSRRLCVTQILTERTRTQSLARMTVDMVLGQAGLNRMHYEY